MFWEMSVFWIDVLIGLVGDMFLVVLFDLGVD